jgi:hypothetical protein
MDVLKLKKMRFKRSFLLLFTFAILLFSCSKIMDDLDFNKFAQIDWSPEYAIPLYGTGLNKTHQKHSILLCLLF